MFVDSIDAPDDRTAEDLLAEYRDDLGDIVVDVGVEAAADRAGVDESDLRSLVRGEPSDLSIGDACAIWALSDDLPDEETIRREIQDSIMLGMASAILDVDTLERELDGDLDAKTIQQKIEGRRPMSLEEYAAIALLIARENKFA
ncbi:DUF5791 family protein [Halanaeroarchaeum sulfurireducens]|uniref:Uncharacterized protein n=1 Tax=Halanaeroarchaeum sulfurireducens TaxID=1604004 RepID=A0A0F7P7A9_9EURY|nr:DUF5791 family protein [Halanaeroarchaeum sulfurireducens]AKH97096.1 hypothetical protein HLASF_0600 [Halanaeroarchaeum sulfurireducens]ALG81497.1 hypothetical protein HLASA_0596 [Halanaeroarchaeum sulfurireducens]